MSTDSPAVNEAHRLELNPRLEARLQDEGSVNKLLAKAQAHAQPRKFLVAVEHNMERGMGLDAAMEAARANPVPAAAAASTPKSYGTIKHVAMESELVSGTQNFT